MLLIMTVLALWVGDCNGDMLVTRVPESMVFKGDEIPQTHEHLVRSLAKSGDICRVYGHNWQGGEDDQHVLMFLGEPLREHLEPGDYRHCVVCGRVERLEWQEVK